MPRRSIDKKDTRSLVQRIELGDFERQAVKDMMMVQGIRAAALPVGIGVAGLAIGAGIFMAYKSLDEIKEWVGDRWEDPFGTKQQSQESFQNDVSNTPIMANTRNTDTMPPTLEGLSAYGGYEATWNVWDATIGRQYRAWTQTNSLIENHETLTFFKNNVQGFLNRVGIYRVDDDLRDAEGNIQTYSQFGYQLAIRETAYRRKMGWIGTGLLSAFGGPFPLLAGGVASWLGFANETEWKSTDPKDAAGYIPDPLLDIAWARISEVAPQPSPSQELIEAAILDSADAGDLNLLWPVNLP
jgi:hypothetical protein